MANSLAVITPPVSHERTNDVFVSANACLQNFPFGREALGKQVHRFAPLLTTALERYWADIWCVNLMYMIAAHNADSTITLL